MGKVIYSAFLVFLLICYGFKSGSKISKGTLIVDVENIEKDEGIIWVGLYDSEQNFLIKENATLVEGVLVEQTNRMTFQLDDLPLGTYAMALVHDINHNGEMDTNFLGIPTEPYAFSNKPKSKWRLPRYHEVKFDFIKPNQVLTVTLERW
jgi:uncharacterized protein (DUF2141 family)